MTAEPFVVDEAADPQRDAVYNAEGSVRELFVDLDPIDPAQLPTFTKAAMDGSGWAGGGSPVFALDVADDSEFAGWHEGNTGVLHLHPRLLDPFTVLHEVAHWLRPLDGHGPQFCGVFVGLVHAGIGPECAAELLYAFAEFAVDVDADWLPVEAPA